MHTLISDIRYGIRMLARKASFYRTCDFDARARHRRKYRDFQRRGRSAAAPAAVPRPDKLVQLFETESAPGNFPMTGQDYLDWRAQNRTFEDMAVYSYPTSYNVSGRWRARTRPGGGKRTPIFSTMPGVQPLHGRAFLNGEDQLGRNHVAVLSYAFWQQTFGGQMSAINSQ